MKTQAITQRVEVTQSATSGTVTSKTLDELCAEGDVVRAARKLGVQSAMESWQRRMNTDPAFRAKAEQARLDEEQAARRATLAQERAARGAPPPPPSEYAEQRVVADWLHARRVVYAANMEAGKRTGRQGFRLKLVGLKAGRPDIEVFSVVPNAPKARGVAIEMKRAKGGRLSPEQEHWRDLLTTCGWLWRCCHGADEAIAWLKELGF